MPENDIKPSDINPTVINVIPNPLNPFGMSEYFIFHVNLRGL